MKVAAIICEYNPFHNGHKFHIDCTKKLCGADAVVAIMSGNFVQRGDASIYSKNLRAKAAIEGGIDLVLELPLIYSTASAELFAKGAVDTLNAFGIIDFLSFGAETSDKDQLLKISDLLAKEPKIFTDKLKAFAASGLSFPVARAKAVGDILEEDSENILSTPNNILGIEYCKALIKSDSSIEPLLVKRTGANHDSNTAADNIASASLIRGMMLSSQADAFSYMPRYAENIFKNQPVHSIKALEKAILCELIKIPAEDLRKIADVSEGLENRIKKAALSATTLEELIDSVKTKRYTHSRIRRIILAAFLGISDAERHASPKYIKVLDHNETGKKLIASAKKISTLPILRNTSQVNKLGNPELKSAWERERLFDKIYTMTEI